MLPVCATCARPIEHATDNVVFIYADDDSRTYGDVSFTHSNLGCDDAFQQSHPTSGSMHVGTWLRQLERTFGMDPNDRTWG